MNRLAHSAKFILLAALAFGFTACSGSGSADKAGSSDSSAIASNAKPAESFGASTNIRYIDMDSIVANYTLAQEISSQATIAMQDLQAKQRQKESEIATFGNTIQQKAQNNGYLSQESYEADMRSLNAKQNQAQNYLMQENQKVQQALAIRDRELQDSIHNYLVDYNATHHYDAILLKAAGIYFNPALDITAEVIEGLNARYSQPSAADALLKKK